MLHAVVTTRSLRFWIALGMALAIAPLALSAVAGYLMLKSGVIASFEDVAARQRQQIDPLQRLRLLLGDVVFPVDEFVDTGNEQWPTAFRGLRQQIEAGFAEVHSSMAAEPQPRKLVERARDDWTAADRLAVEVISIASPPGGPQAAERVNRFHALIAAAIDKLGAAYDDLMVDLRQDHDVALLAYERSEWLAGIAAAVSVLMIVAGVATIGRMISVSIDRLVDGATRFAAGDRNHRIDVRIPPELRMVAGEFNRMIVRIHEAEEALADLARRDGLTKLYNRRAFDEALAEAFARRERLDEELALLMIDIDHFKQVNDTHGHAFGDDVLRIVAQTMAADVRVFDRVFRIGGEEFAVILLGTDIGSAEVTAERLREAIAARRIPNHGTEFSSTVSIGVAAAGRTSEPSRLVGAADAALYQAKAAGRNRVVVDAASRASGRSPGPRLQISRDAS